MPVYPFTVLPETQTQLYARSVHTIPHLSFSVFYHSHLFQFLPMNLILVVERPRLVVGEDGLQILRVYLRISCGQPIRGGFPALSVVRTHRLKRNSLFRNKKVGHFLT